MLLISAQAQKPYSIILAIPSQAVLTEHTENCRKYVHEDGDYTITVLRFPAKSAAEAEKMLTQGAVCFGKTGRRFGMEERILRWYAHGQRNFADILLDNAWCYSVVFSAKSKKYDAPAVEIFSTFGIFYDEGA